MDSCITSKNFNSTTKLVMPLNINILNKKPRLSIISPNDLYFFTPMAANDRYLLHCFGNFFSLLDDQGIKKSSISINSCVIDFHWSSYLNQFLVLTGLNTIEGFDCTIGKIRNLSTLKTDNERMCTFSCYEETLLICLSITGSVI